MRPMKPDHTPSRRAFFVALICLLIGASGYDNRSLSGISALAVAPMYGFFIYGIVARVKEKRAFIKAVELYESNIKIQKEQAEMKENLKLEKDAYERSTYYRQSPFTKEIVDWLLSCFDKEYSSVDKGCDVESFKVRFSFTVCENDVGCNYSSFSFVKRRYASLESRLEKAALARALAMGLKVAIMEKYRDRGAAVDVAYNDYKRIDSSCTIVTVIYRAENSCFVQAKQW